MLPARETLFQESPRVRSTAGGHLLRRSRNYYFTSGVSAFRAEIDHVVGGFDHIEMMLNHEHGMAGIHQAI